MESHQVTSPTPEYLRTEEAAQRVCVSVRTIRSWIDKRILPACKPTKRTILIRVADLDKAMLRFRVGR